MRRINRRPLTAATLAKLAALEQKVMDAPAPRDTALKLWDSKPKRAFKEIREVLTAMAPGRARCMYCEDSEGTDIEHFWPKADYPHRTFLWENYLIACSHCNSNLKRNQFPLDAENNPLLIDPSAEDPLAHLQFLPTTGEFEAIGPKGDDSIRVFGLNDHRAARRLPTARLDALRSLVALLLMYDQQARAGDPEASATRNALLRSPFSSVLVWLLSVTDKPGAPLVLGAEICDVIARHGVARWICDDA